MGVQEFPSKPVNKGGVVIGTINGPTEVAVGAQDSYLVADSTVTPGAKWQTYRKYNVVQLTSGTSWTVPATVESIDLFMVGGGRGGKGSQTNGSTAQSTSEEGGQGGTIFYLPNYATTPGAAITYSIGAGSAGSTGSANVAAAGNTTFGTLVAAGSGTRVGSLSTWSNPGRQDVRGVYDVYSANSQAGGSGSTGAVNNTNLPDLVGLPAYYPGAFIAITLATAVTTQPYNNSHNPLISAGTGAGERYWGISPLWMKLFSGLTAPTGGSANLNELTTNAITAGWGGKGGSGQNTAAPYTNSAPGHGGGHGASVNTSTTTGNRVGTGGNAAANSGAGGGGGAAYAQTAVVVQGIGGAGGSGVIIIGYWA